MAGTAGMGAGRMAVLVMGSGVTGAYLLENRAWIGKILGEGGKDQGMEAVRDLMKNVENLAQIVDSPSAQMPASVTIIDSSGQAGLSERGILAAAGLSLVSAAAIVAYFRRSRFASQLWVSKGSFQEALEKLQNQVNKLTENLTVTNKELVGRISQIDVRIANNAEELSLKMDEEISQTKKRINVVGLSVEEVQKVVDGLQNRLEDVQAKLNYANKGILLMCSIVGSLPHQERKTKRLWDDLKRFVAGKVESLGVDQDLKNAMRTFSQPVPTALPQSSPLVKRRGSSFQVGLQDSLKLDGVSVREFNRPDAEGDDSLRHAATAPNLSADVALE